MKKRGFKTILIGLLMLVMMGGCSSSSKSSANEETDLLDQIREKGVLVIGTEGTYSPNSYHDEAGNLVGFDVEVAAKLAEKLGVKAEFVESDWDSLFASMDSGRIDVVINEVNMTEERALKYDFSDPYTYVHGALLVAANNEEIKSFDDIVGKKSAQNLASTWTTTAESYGAEVVGVESMNQSVELLLAGRADCTLNAETAFGDYMKNHPEAEVKVAALSDSTVCSVVPVKKGNEKFLKAVNEALKEMRESGELSEISIKYFGVDVTKE